MMNIYEWLATLPEFQWDEGNAEKNWIKHRVTREECEQLFRREPLLVEPDDDHSGREARYFALGWTEEGRRLAVVFTVRGEMIRVISARPMDRRERRTYEDATEEVEADS
jgi:uncharacterized protein